MKIESCFRIVSLTALSFKIGSVLGLRENGEDTLAFLSSHHSAMTGRALYHHSSLSATKRVPTTLRSSGGT